MDANRRGADQAAECLRDLQLFIAELARRNSTVTVPGACSPVPKFLALCARSLTQPASPETEHSQGYSGEFYRARDIFVRAGLEALAARPLDAEDDWHQIGIRPRDASTPTGELYRQVACLARDLLTASVADDFFFMHKPPGLRLRFRPVTSRERGQLAGAVDAAVARWRTDGLIDKVEPGVYEPESQLFGGDRSMGFVHALFTVDSLLWLDYHVCRADETGPISPPWVVSLAILRTVFVGLQIAGWEDIGVWDRIRDIGGRQLAGPASVQAGFADVSQDLRHTWSHASMITEQLHPAVKAIVARHQNALLTGATRWREGYFGQDQASLGPRAAAAIYVIFHWNRGALTRTEQALLAESLAERMFDDARQ